MSTLPREHLLDRLLGHRLGMKQRVDPRILRSQVLDQSRPRKALRDKHRADLGRIVARHELRTQSLVEGDRRRLARRVIDHVGRHGVPGLRGDGHDHAVVGLDHARQEFLGEPVVGQRVDFEHAAGLGRGCFQDGLTSEDAGVVDEDAGSAEDGADLGAYLGDVRGGGDVAFKVADGVGEDVVGCWGGDVQDGNFDATVTELLGHASPDSVAAACEDDDLSVPVVFVAGAIIQRASVEPAAQTVDSGLCGQHFENFVEIWMLLDEITAFHRVLS